MSWGGRGKLCYNKDFGNCISKSTWPKIYMQNMDQYLNFQGTHSTSWQESVTKMDFKGLGVLLEGHDTFEQVERKDQGILRGSSIFCLLSCSVKPPLIAQVVCLVTSQFFVHFSVTALPCRNGIVSLPIYVPWQTQVLQARGCVLLSLRVLSIGPGLDRQLWK